MTAAELSDLMAGPSPHAVLDLRERAAYEGGHIFRATNLPRRLLDETDDVVLNPYEKGREAMEAYLKWEADLDPAALDAARSK